MDMGLEHSGNKQWAGYCIKYNDFIVWGRTLEIINHCTNHKLFHNLLIIYRSTIIFPHPRFVPMVIHVAIFYL